MFFFHRGVLGIRTVTREVLWPETRISTRTTRSYRSSAAPRVLSRSDPLRRRCQTRCDVDEVSAAAALLLVLHEAPASTPPPPHTHTHTHTCTPPPTPQSPSIPQEKGGVRYMLCNGHMPTKDRIRVAYRKMGFCVCRPSLLRPARQ